MDNKRKVLIGVGVLTVLSLGLWIFVAVKKKNNEGWKLLRLPDGNTKRNRKITLKRPN